jgi:hypothetical protein
MATDQKIPDECEDDFWWRLVIAARGSTLHQFFYYIYILNSKQHRRLDPNFTHTLSDFFFAPHSMHFDFKRLSHSPHGPGGAHGD